MTSVRPSFSRLPTLVLTGLLLVGAATMVRPWLRDTFVWRGLLAAPWVDRETARQDIQAARRPGALLAELWQTGRLTHRQAALAAAFAPELQARVPDALRERLLHEAAADPDVSLRERALGRLSTLDTPARREMVTRQLTDADPELRRLGLNHLARLGVVADTPLVLPLLADPEPKVALLADAVLRRWSGLDQGLRLSRSPVAASLLTAPEPPPELFADLRAAAVRWEAWWSAQPAAAGLLPLPERAPAAPLPSLYAPGPRLQFTGLLHARGGPVTLADFTALRGKKVLLNFWATWCPACLVELPTLRELQRRHPDDLVIVGVSLDRLDQLADDSAGLVAATVPQDQTAQRAELRKRVAAVAGRQRLNYAVWLDPDSELGACFDGGELPTNVLLDAEGRVRRRFVGERSLAVWEAMLAELNAPGAGGESPEGSGLPGPAAGVSRPE